MKVFTTFILAGFTLILTSCSKPQQHDIVGRWQEVGTTSLGAFHEDGTIELSSGEGKLSGKYSFITDGKIKIELSGKGEALGPRVYRFSLSCGSCLFVHGHFTLLFVRRTDAILRLSVSQQFCRFPPDQSLLFPDNLLLVLSGFCICDSSGSRHLFAQAPTVYAFSNIGNRPEVWPTHRELTFGNCFATLN